MYAHGSSYCGAESNPVEAWARDPKRVRKARLFLQEARRAGASGVDALQAHGIAHSWDPQTIHLAVSLEGEPHCEPSGLCLEGQMLRETWREAVDNSYYQGDPDHLLARAAEAKAAWLDHKTVCFFDPTACRTCGLAADRGFRSCVRCGTKRRESSYAG